MLTSRRAHARHDARRGALRFADAATLVAVGLVVLLVSLPRLRDFALRENESDARTLVARLGQLAEREAQVAESGNVEALVAREPALLRQLDDLEFLDRGRLLRRHGYLFELLSGAGARAAGTNVRAWPWQYRKTGHSAYAWGPARALLVHANAGGEWSGPEFPPEVADPSWKKLER